jgi:hypothetical protein
MASPRQPRPPPGPPPPGSLAGWLLTHYSSPDLHRPEVWFRSDEYAELTKHSYLDRQRHFGQLEHSIANRSSVQRASLRKAAVSVMEAVQFGQGGYTSGCWFRTLQAARSQPSDSTSAGSRGSSNGTFSGSDSSSSSFARVGHASLI